MAIWFKELQCPVCKTGFKAPRVRTRDIKPVKRDTDFHYDYEGINPLFYQITVCPGCFYSEKYTTFDKLTEKKISILKEDAPARKKLAGIFNFEGERNFAIAIKTYELAAHCSGCIKKKASDEIAGHYLRAAWIARDERKELIEKHYLTLAYNFYLQAYMKEYPRFGKLGEVGYIYIMGEIARRIERYDEALKWFAKVIEHPDTKYQAEIERLTRDAWQETKAERDASRRGNDIEEIF